MSITIKKIDEFESYKGEGRFNYAAKGLGITAWGMNVLKLPAGWKDYPDHDHLSDGQEEAYVLLEGSATLEADGKKWELTPFTFVHAAPGQKRKFTPGPNGVTILGIGGVPGKAYEPRR